MQQEWSYFRYAPDSCYLISQLKEHDVFLTYSAYLAPYSCSLCKTKACDNLCKMLLVSHYHFIITRLTFLFVCLHITSVSLIYFVLLSVFSWIIGMASTFSGANKSVYAPEPFDVGRILQADILSNGNKISVITSAPIDPGWLFSKFSVFPFYILFPRVLIHIAICTDIGSCLWFICFSHVISAERTGKCWFCCF